CEEDFLNVAAKIMESNGATSALDIEKLRLYSNLYDHISTTRKLRFHGPIPTTADIRTRVLPSYAPAHFKDIVRVTPSQFDMIVDLIKDSRQFQKNIKRQQQEPVKDQLLVALYRLSSPGISIPHAALTFGYGRGTVHKFT
ncbi:hypothetical protein BGZ76_005617, partial [Entomortierella beljakovae]